MANYRTVHTRLWSKAWFEESSIHAKLLFIYLFTNSHRNESGLYEITKKKMADETGMSVRQVQAALNELHDHGRVAYDEEACVVWVVNVVEYAHLNDRARMSVQKDLQHCRSEKLAQAFKAKYGTTVKTLRPLPFPVEGILKKI